MTPIEAIRNIFDRAVRRFHPRYQAPEFYPPNPIWRDLRHATMGGVFSLTVMFALAAAEDEVQPLPRTEAEVHEVVMDLGHVLCSRHSSRARTAANLDDDYVRFRCYSGTIIEEKVILR